MVEDAEDRQPVAQQAGYDTAQCSPLDQDRNVEVKPQHVEDTSSSGLMEN